MKHHTTLLLTLAGGFFASAAAADTIVQTGDILELGEVTLTLDQFDPMDGQRVLESVQIDLASSMHGGFTTSGSGTPVTLVVTFDQEYSLNTSPLGMTHCILDISNPNQAMMSASFFVADDDSNTLTGAVALAPWIGPDTVSLTSIGTWMTVANPPEDIIDVGAGLNAEYTVTYVYSVIAACPADVDGDGDVGFSDLVAVLNAWGPCPDCAADISGDGEVGFDDLIALLAAWGECA